MKKRMVTISILVSMILMTGCQQYPLTDKETDEFSEYVAGFILEHERNYKEKLVTATPTPSPLPTPTPAPGTPKPTEAAIEQNTSEPGNKEGTNANAAANADLTEVIGVDGLTAEYSSYEITDSYKGQDGTDFPVRNGYKFLIAKFIIKNTASKEAAIALGDARVRYKLDINTKTMLNPELTIIEQDLGFLKTTLAPGADMEAVVIFSVSDKLKIDTMNLIASKGSLTSIIKMK